MQGWQSRWEPTRIQPKPSQPNRPPLPEIRVALGKVLVVKAVGTAVEHVPEAFFPERRWIRLVDICGDLRLTPGL